MNTKRTFLERALASGMEAGLVGADDVLRHATPEALALHLPNDLKAKLLKASLGAEAMTPALVVETLGTVAIAANLPPEVVWGCVADVAVRVLGSSASHTKRTSAVTPTSAATPTSAGPTAKSPAAETPASGKSAASLPKPSATPSPSNNPGAEVPAAPLPPLGDSASKLRPKPNAKIKVKTKVKLDPGEDAPRLPGVPTAGDDEDRASRARTAPVIPRSEFEVDTDVGEDWSVDDDIVDIEEAEAVGAIALDDPALDWKADDETIARKDHKR